MPNHGPSLACTLVGCCCILIGVVLGSIGAGITAGAAEMNPDLHFKMQKKGCYIQSVLHVAQTVQSSNRRLLSKRGQIDRDLRTTGKSTKSGSKNNRQTSSCQDVYWYTVIKVENIDYVYLRAEEKNAEFPINANASNASNASNDASSNAATPNVAFTSVRNESTQTYAIDPGMDVSKRKGTVSTGDTHGEYTKGSCEDPLMSKANPQKPAFDNHTIVDCWEQTKDMPTDTPVFYHCNNPLCIKIFSPHTKEALEAGGEALASTGQVLNLMGIVALVFAVAFYVYASQKRNKVMPPGGFQPNQPQPGQVMMIGGPQQQQQQQQQQQFQQPQQMFMQTAQATPVQMQQPMVIQPQQIQQQQNLQQLQQFQQQQQRRMTVAVPPNSIGGAMIIVATPTGQHIQVPIPQGMVPGQQFQVAY
jgi:hypothetical protein